MFVVLGTVDWESWMVRVTAGSTVWDTTDTASTKLPYRTVGNWQNHNLIQWLDTFFQGSPEEIPVRTFLSLNDHYADRKPLEPTDEFLLGLLIS
jgi:hypothetical protein